MKCEKSICVITLSLNGEPKIGNEGMKTVLTAPVPVCNSFLITIPTTIKFNSWCWKRGKKWGDEALPGNHDRSEMTSVALKEGDLDHH